jgi:hypothetical protein
MSKQVYFVVYYDTEDKQLYQDTGTLLARFGEGSIWDSEEEEWNHETEISVFEEAQNAMDTAISNTAV